MSIETAEEEAWSLTDEAVQEAPTEATTRRKKQPFKEATVRPPTLLEAMSDTDGDDLFGDLMDEAPALRDLYVDQETLLSLKGTNGLKAISSFTGCGGSMTGFAWAGWDELMSIEFVKAARETLASNYPSEIIEPEVVREFVEGWLKEHDSSLPVQFTKATRSRGNTIPSMVDWEKTFLAVAKTGDKALAEEAEQLRYDATVAALTGKMGEGILTIYGDDIRGLSGKAVLDVLGMEPGELDCFEGSPPCKSFSTAGLREEGWGKIDHYSDERHQSTDGLFIEYMRLLTDFRPKSFIAENVAGLEMGDAAIQVLIPLMEAMTALGYTVEAKRVNASDHGVAQVRPRVFIQGIRKDLIDPDTGHPMRPSWPRPFSYVYTVRDALEAAGESPVSELDFSWIGSRGDFLERIGGEDNVPSDSWLHTQVQRYERWKAEGKEGLEEITPASMRYGLGTIWHQLKWGAAPENKTYQLIRCHPNQPSPTITATSAGNVPAAGPTHPDEPRKFTINEYRWLFSFPHDYNFTGTLEQQGERMGRSVAPHLMKEIAEELARNIKRARIEED